MTSKGAEEGTNELRRTPELIFEGAHLAEVTSAFAFALVLTLLHHLQVVLNSVLALVSGV